METLEKIGRIIIMNIINKIEIQFHKKDAKMVMGKLSECESYQNYLIARDSTQKLQIENNKQIENYFNDMINMINTEIRIESEKGNFKIKYILNEHEHENECEVIRKKIKELKKIYKNKGYKIKVKFVWYELFVENYYKIIISWKHWR